MSRRKVFLMLFVLLITSTLIVGCSSGYKGVTETSKSNSVGAIPQDNSVAPSYGGGSEMSKDEAHPQYEVELYERKIIKNGSVTIEANKPKDLETEIVEVLNDFNGYIVNTTQSGNDENYRSELTVKIPYDKFDNFITKVKELADVRHNNISTQDITEEFIDLEARQNALKLQEERLLEMLVKAESVEELLKVENELSRVRYELEKVEGRIRYLDNAVSYSTLRISIQQKVEPTKPQVDSVWDEIWFSFTDGIGTFFNAILHIIKGVVWLTPFLIIVIPVGFIIYKKKFKK